MDTFSVWIENGCKEYPLSGMTCAELNSLNTDSMFRWRRPALFMARSVEAIRLLMEVGGLSLRDKSLFLDNWTSFEYFLYLVGEDEVHRPLTEYVMSFATIDDMTRCDRKGRTMLCFAKTVHDIERILSSLEDRSIALNQADHFGRTLLMRNVSNREVSEWLIENGVEINYQDKDGDTYLMLLRGEDDEDERVRHALEWGADPFLENNMSKSGLS